MRYSIIAKTESSTFHLINLSGEFALYDKLSPGPEYGGSGVHPLVAL